MSDDWSPRTRLVHGGARRSQYGETSEAIFLTQGFVYPDAATAEARFIQSGPDEFIYARYGNPTVRMFEDRMAILEGAEAAFATASGMAAVHGALFCQLKAGDHVVSARGALRLLPLHRRDPAAALRHRGHPRRRHRPRRLEGRLPPRHQGRLPRDRSRTRRSRSSTSPASRALAHAVGAQVVVDNVFATPVFQRCLELGADVVIYSATKHIDGQGRCLGGVVLGTEDFIRGPLETFLKHTGGAL